MSKLNITSVMNNFSEFQAGCFQVRINTPFIELQRRGHQTDYVISGQYEYPEVDTSDIIVYSRSYAKDIFRSLWKHKSDGKKIVYDIDDDVWNIPEMNPAHQYFQKEKHTVTGLCKESHMVTTTNQVLADLIKKETGQTNVVVLPNALDLTKFKKRANKSGLRIGWTGGANHYEDLKIILDVIIDLQKTYDFEFYIQGLTGNDWRADAYTTHLILSRGASEESKVKLNQEKLKIYEKFKQLKNFTHIHFYPPEMYPSILMNMDLDIGLIPLVGHKFDSSKSIIKYLEYTATGSAVIASNELPYQGTVLNTVKNKHMHWYKAIEKLINNEQLREELANKQYKQLFPKYDIQTVGQQYEDAYLKLYGQS
jgi:O-antigen biosynthesis protein